MAYQDNKFVTESPIDFVSELQKQYDAFVTDDCLTSEMEFIKTLRFLLQNAGQNVHRTNGTEEVPTVTSEIGKTTVTTANKEYPERVIQMREFIETHLLLNPSQLRSKYKHLIDNPTPFYNNDSDNRKTYHSQSFQQKVKEYKLQVLLRFELATTFQISEENDKTTTHFEYSNENCRNSTTLLLSASVFPSTKDMKLKERTYLSRRDLKIIKTLLDSISTLLDFDVNNDNHNHRGFANFLDDIIFNLYGDKLPFSLYKLYKTFWLPIPSRLEVFIKTRRQFIGFDSRRDECRQQENEFLSNGPLSDIVQSSDVALDNDIEQTAEVMTTFPRRHCSPLESIQHSSSGDESSSLSSDSESEEKTNDIIVSSETQNRQPSEITTPSERLAKWFSFQISNTADSQSQSESQSQLQPQTKPRRVPLSSTADSFFSFIISQKNKTDNNILNNNNNNNNNNKPDRSETFHSNLMLPCRNYQKSEKQLTKKENSKRHVDFNVSLLRNIPHGALRNSILFSSPNVVKERTLTYKRKHKTFLSSDRQKIDTPEGHSTVLHKKRKRLNDDNSANEILTPFGGFKKRNNSENNIKSVRF
jgi:hypothetical protein